MYKTLVYFSLLSIAIAFLIGLFKFKTLSADLKRVVLILITAVVAESTVFILQKFYRYTNWVYYITSPFEYATTAWFYVFVIQSKLIKRIILISIPVSVLLAVLNFILFQRPPIANTNFFILESILITMWTLLYLSSVFKNKTKPPKINRPEVIIAIGMLFFFAFSIVFEAVYRYLIITRSSNALIFYKIYPTLAIANILMYLAMAFGFIIAPKVKRENSHQ